MASSGDVDRISSLPDHIREQILTLVPLRDAVKASVLTTEWRNMWRNLPSLLLDETFCQGKTVATIDKLMLNICRVLLLHRGALKELSLSIPLLESFPEHVDQILMFIQDKPINNLSIKSERYNLPSCLFSSPFWRKLKILRLSGCLFPTSSSVSFEEFSILTVLELRNVKLLHASAKFVWSFRCPVLSALTLEGLGGHSQKPPILIDAPRLKYFNFVGNFITLHLKTPSLKNAILLKETTSLRDKFADAITNIWSGLAAVESLSVSGHFCRYIAAARGKCAIVKHLGLLEMLRHITFDEICLSRQGHEWSLRYILLSSPNLQRVTIHLTEVPNASLISRYGSAVDVVILQSTIEDEDGVSKYELTKLKRVEVKRLKGTRHEMTFIRWFLNSSPALDQMEVTLSMTLSVSQHMSILKELNGFQRASKKARIVIN